MSAADSLASQSLFNDSSAFNESPFARVNYPNTYLESHMSAPVHAEKLSPELVALLTSIVDTLTPLVAGRPLLTLALGALKAYLAINP